MHFFIMLGLMAMMAVALPVTLHEQDDNEFELRSYRLRQLIDVLLDKRIFVHVLCDVK
jgi:hypothetical protein